MVRIIGGAESIVRNVKQNKACAEFDGVLEV
jgi:hypothetical protein